jgi:hypothetical protein
MKNCYHFPGFPVDNAGIVIVTALKQKQVKDKRK